MHIQSDYPNDFETTKLPPQHAARMNGFPGANNFRASFSALPNTTRTQANPSVIGAASLRDTNNYYPTSADMFSSQVTSPIQSHLQSYEANNGYEFGGPKAYLDNFAPNGHMVHHQGGRLSIAHPQQQQPHHKFNGHQFGNGIQLTSQTPYGPHVPVTGSTGPGGNLSQGSAPREITSSTSGNVPNQEEISTIFVVGFPDDMQEREFQNMFTFSAGFEAATLKIPNKEYTAYGANGIRGFQGYNGSNDPYNLVTVNQGGVVVDGGRDGTMSSWPAVPGDDGTGNHFPGTNLAPRKQIIGFAKFKSREAALEARDVLQGRRVDIEKGAVLKAEMAKKNLHTKRGVGPVAGPAAPALLNVSNSIQSNAHGHGPMITHTNDSFSLPNDGFPPRDRDLPLGGIDLGQHGTWRDQLQKDVLAVTNGIGSARTAEFHPRKEREDEEHRRRERDVTMYSAMGFGNAVGHSATRGPRERAEEEERERRRRDKEAVLRASNSTAFDAFHSVPAGNAPPLSRQSSNLSGIVSGNSLLPTVEANSSHGSPLLSNAFASNQREEAVGPWDNIHNAPIGITRPRSSSQRSVSPPDLQERRDAHYSPSTDVEQAHHLHRAPSESSTSSVVGSHSVGVIGGGSSIASNASEGDLTRAMNELVLNTDNGTTSPQLPSPASGASSISTKNAVDQNPPINTLYVGNLPATSPSINFSNDQLEESIRQLFTDQPGYRRLVFRQKNNGPMCFVEFEDVDHAAKALADLYGNTLSGLVKGGIRLSYSKNPLGVRTPTSATGANATFQQQQIMQPLNFQPDAFQSRGGDDLGTQPHISRRDVGGPFGNSFLTSPPPRFTSPPAGNFGQAPLSNMPHSFGMRPNGGSLSSLYSYSLAAGGVGNPTSNFSPFGMSNPPTIPEHTPSSDDQALHSSHHFAHRTLSPPVNLEAARAG